MMMKQAVRISEIESAVSIQNQIRLMMIITWMMIMKIIRNRNTADQIKRQPVTI
ncbi:MAG: hypothetical protein LBN31_05495 [Hungatella sp.]|nr:hypothetical protein [Hungatella sp.]MDR2022717.1 hypothetical protein [Hungatella sp.]